MASVDDFLQCVGRHRREVRDLTHAKTYGGLLREALGSRAFEVNVLHPPAYGKPVWSARPVLRDAGSRYLILLHRSSLYPAKGLSGSVTRQVRESRQAIANRVRTVNANEHSGPSSGISCLP